MDANKLADVFERFVEAVNDVVGELRDNAGNDQPEAGVAARGREVEDGPRVAEDDLVEVNAGDLWRLINRSRKMIRLAREGKIPDMEGRAPLCRAIKAIKQAGLGRKPYNLRD